jgi:hypothetical protein
MSVTLTQARNIVMSLLNASDEYGSHDEPRHPLEEIDEVIRQADYQIVALICSMTTHPQRNYYVTTVSVTNGAQQPSSVGGYGSVRITLSDASVVNAVYVDFEQFVLWSRSSRYDASEGYYSTDSTRFYFTGASCVVDTFAPTYDDTISTLRSPDEYYPAVVAKSLADLYAKEGSNSGAGGYYAQMAQAYLGQIMRATTPIPPVAAYRGGAE